MTRPKKTALETLTASLRALDIEGVELAFVLGSGLGVFAERLVGARTIPYAEIDGMPQSAVPGHAGCLVVGEIAGKRVLVQQGRVHLYEGWSAHEVTRAVRAFAALGCRGIVLTNAAGGLRPEWKPGTLMRIADHIDLQGRTPLADAERGFGSPYDPALGAALEEGADQAGVELVSGVYAALLGPSYETPAEVRMLRWMGADAVGMSTAAEALAARAAGMRVAAVSCITNQAAGISGAALSHQEVIEAGRAAAQNFCALLERAVPHLVGELGE
jgi:purine-nucleoside phosphorylase